MALMVGGTSGSLNFWSGMRPFNDDDQWIGGAQAAANTGIAIYVRTPSMDTLTADCLYLSLHLTTFHSGCRICIGKGHDARLKGWESFHIYCVSFGNTCICFSFARQNFFSLPEGNAPVFAPTNRITQSLTPLTLRTCGSSSAIPRSNSAAQ